MEIRTHESISHTFCGIPESISPGSAAVRMTTTQEMAADTTGLVHGGFIFGLADHAAMLAVNHPNVVLGQSNCRFLKPVVVGEEVEARSLITETNGKKREVQVSVTSDKGEVFTGTFICFVPERHVLGG